MKDMSGVGSNGGRISIGVSIGSGGTTGSNVRNGTTVVSSQIMDLIAGEGQRLNIVSIGGKSKLKTSESDSTMYA